MVSRPTPQCLPLTSWRPLMKLVHLLLHHWVVQGHPLVPRRWWQRRRRLTIPST